MQHFKLMEATETLDRQDDVTEPSETIANMDETDWMAMLLEMRILGA